MNELWPFSLNVSQLLLNDVRQEYVLSLYIGRMWDAHANRRKRGKVLAVITHAQSIAIDYRNNSTYYANTWL